MHHYTTTYANGKRVRGSADIEVGDLVRSRYRAHWRGTVLALDNGMATVRMEFDRRGVAVRKPRTYRYHCNWFVLVSRSS
jgi:hypothetical protein